MAVHFPSCILDLCTEWPKGLTDENCEQHFPIESITRDYCFTSNSIRDPRSRVVTSKVCIMMLHQPVRES